MIGANVTKTRITQIKRTNTNFLNSPTTTRTKTNRKAGSESISGRGQRQENEGYRTATEATKQTGRKRRAMRTRSLRKDGNKIFGFGDSMCFVEEFVRQDLLSYINKNIQNVHIMYDVLEKVKQLSKLLFEQNIVHNDFRAPNILVRQEKDLVLAVTDFEDAQEIKPTDITECEQIRLAEDNKRDNKCTARICRNLKSTDLLTFLKEILYVTDTCFSGNAKFEWQDKYNEEYQACLKLQDEIRTKNRALKEQQQQQHGRKAEDGPPKKRTKLTKLTKLSGGSNMTYRDLKNAVRMRGDRGTRQRFNQIVSKRRPFSYDAVSPHTKHHILQDSTR